MTPEERRSRIARSIAQEGGEPEATPAPRAATEASPATLHLRARVTRKGRKNGVLSQGSSGFLECAISNGSNVTGTLRLEFLNRSELLKLSNSTEPFDITIITP